MMSTAAPPDENEIAALCRGLGLEPPAEWLAAEGTARGLPIPWWAKLGAKLLLARLPVSYRAWARLGMFRHGDGVAAAPRAAVFRHHAALHAARTAAPLQHVIELGPGDSVATALFAQAAGATATLIDTDDFATTDMAHYRAVAALTGKDECRAVVEAARDRQAMLAALGTRYETDGIAALRRLPPQSADLIFSNAVLEHVARDELPAVMIECARVLRPCGIASHGIDLHDHLGGGLNHLRFSRRRWEGAAFRSSGFYTNRLPFSAYVGAARAAGFAIEVPWIRGWRSLPLAIEAIHRDERGATGAERRIAGFGIVLRKPFAAPVEPPNAATPSESMM